MKYLKNYNTFMLESLDYSDKYLKTLVDLNISDFVDGYFNCSSNKLISLEGAPKRVLQSFSCEHNQITSLKYAPEMVGDNFNCYNNKLTNLVGAPNKIYGSFYCYNNNLTTLEGAPEYVAGNFHCSDNKLETLEYLPIVDGKLHCYNNNWIKPIPHKIMKKYYLRCLDQGDSDSKYVYTQEQFNKFSSFDFQKEFLEREPENFMDLKPFGYASGLEELFPHLFDMDELGLLD